MAQTSRAGRKAKRIRQHYHNSISLTRYLGVHNSAAVKQIMKNPKGGFAMAYEEYHRDCYKLQAKDRRYLRLIALWRVSDGEEITKIKFDDYKHDLLTQVSGFDNVELGVAPANTVRIASVAELMDELVLGNGGVEMEIDNDAG